MNTEQDWVWSLYSDLYPVAFVEEYRGFWLVLGPCRLTRSFECLRM